MQRTMLRRSAARMTGWVVAVLLAVPAAAAPQVVDNAKFFSNSVVQQANEEVRQIRSKYGKDLQIETYETPPAGRTVPADKPGKDAFFVQWVEERAAQTGTDGIFVLICRKPSHLQIVPGQHTRERLFTTSNAGQLAQLMTAQFQNRQFDAGLASGITYVRNTLQTNGANPSNAGPMTPPRGQSTPTGSSRSTPSGSSHMCLWSIVIIVGIFIIIRIFSGFAGRSGGGYPGGGGAGFQGGPGYGAGGGGYGGAPGYGGYGGGGGGGFMKGMLGGILGGAAGSWLYDRFNRHDTASGNYGNTGGDYQQPSGYSDSSQQSDAGQGFNQGAGGDFDSGSSSASAGSDFDSGSSSSGFDSGGSSDSGGGGDFGGGSSDSSGGGGDF